MESLDYVAVLLSSNQLFMPNLNVNNQAMDTDINNWLNNMVTFHPSGNDNENAFKSVDNELNFANENVDGGYRLYIGYQKKEDVSVDCVAKCYLHFV